MRPRHIPERTCVVCREKKPKSELTRIVRTPDGEVVIDPTGRLNGRGAYLCDNPGDWVEGLTKGRLARALQATISPEDQDALLAHGPGNSHASTKDVSVSEQ